MKLIQTKDYLLLIDEEAEMKHCNPINICHAHKSEPCDKCHRIEGIPVLGHYPLTKEAKELDLPLLPNTFESSNVEEDAYKEFSKTWSFGDRGDQVPREFFLAGYKAAQPKQFGLEDMKKAMELGLTLIDGNVHNQERFESFIQSLSTQQLPKEFIPEYEREHDDTVPFPKMRDSKTIKKIRNSEGKQELVGVYKY